MKQKHINANTVRDNLPTPSGEFFTATMTQLEYLATREEKPMKRKVFSSILIATLILALLAASALAAYALTRSKEVDAISQARKALEMDYGLTTETFGLFYTVAEQDGETWTVTFYAEWFYPPMLGDYTVTLTPGKEAQTSWTHDDGVDPGLWQDGGLDAPVWGQPQMLAGLHDNEAAAAIIASMDREAVEPRRTEPPGMDMLKEGESIWQGHILRHAEPGLDDIQQEEAIPLARQALMEETTLTKEALDTADVTVNFYERDTGNSLWGFDFYLVDNGIEQNYGVMLDAHTGEILHIDIVTGANG